MLKICNDHNFLKKHRSLCVQAMKKFSKQRVSRQQAMQLDSSENNPMEGISTSMMLEMTRRTEDFPKFFDKHDTSGDGKLQRPEFRGVLEEMGLILTPKQITELYFVLDRDGDGEIDTKELLRALTDTKRATQISWIRFEEAENIILSELSTHLLTTVDNTSQQQSGNNGGGGGNGGGNGGNGGGDGLTGGDATFRSQDTDRTDGTTPNNVEHTELYRLLLHARAEFDLSYPSLASNTIHPRAAARLHEDVDEDTRQRKSNIDSYGDEDGDKYEYDDGNKYDDYDMYSDEDSEYTDRESRRRRYDDGRSSASSIRSGRSVRSVRSGRSGRSVRSARSARSGRSYYSSGSDEMSSDLSGTYDDQRIRL